MKNDKEIRYCTATNEREIISMLLIIDFIIFIIAFLIDSEKIMFEGLGTMVFSLLVSIWFICDLTSKRELYADNMGMLCMINQSVRKWNKIIRINIIIICVEIIPIIFKL